MSKSKLFSQLVVDFFEEHLANEQGSPATTVASYATTTKLLLHFASVHLNKKIDTLRFKDIDHHLVLDFLKHLEQDRGNLPQTRNNRLAAICTLVRYLARENPLMLEPCFRICSIRAKKVIDKVMPSLTVKETKAFLSVIPRTSIMGLRDHALFLFLHDSGARVSEATNLIISDLRLEAPFRATLIGKGGKQRIIPLNKETAAAIIAYLKERPETHKSVFLNHCGNPLMRSGVGYLTTKYWKLASVQCPSLANTRVTPHTFRHTCALHTINSGIHIETLQDFLGHANLNTTKKYTKLTAEMKQKAHEAREPIDKAVSSEQIRNWHKPEISRYLDQLVKDATGPITPPP